MEDEKNTQQSGLRNERDDLQRGVAFFTNTIKLMMKCDIYCPELFIVFGVASRVQRGFFAIEQNAYDHLLQLALD